MSQPQPQEGPSSDDVLLSSIPNLGPEIPHSALGTPQLTEYGAPPPVPPSRPEWILDQIDVSRIPGHMHSREMPTQAQQTWQPGQVPQAAPAQQFAAPASGNPDALQAWFASLPPEQQRLLFQQVPAPAHQPQVPPVVAPPMYQHHSPPPAFEQPSVPVHAQSAYVPPPQLGSVPGSVQVPPKPVQHPVVGQLLRDFGLAYARTAEAVVGPYRFRIREANAEVTNYVLGVAGRSALTDADYISRSRLMLAALGVVSINDTPVVDMFTWDRTRLPKGTVIDPNFPSSAVVVALAPELFMFFMETLSSEVINDIADAYDKEFGGTEAEETTNTPVGILANEQRVRFKCPAEACGFVEDVVPDYADPQHQTVHARFCRKCGTKLSPIGRLKDMADVPLA